MNTQPNNKLTIRRWDIDWLRVLATLAVFLFHCARFFNDEGWHVKNNQTEHEKFNKIQQKMINYEVNSRRRKIDGMDLCAYPSYAKLKRLPDKRDKRGKRHDLGFVLGGVVLAILSGRAYASSIHRFIKNKLGWLGRVLGYRDVKLVSRAQLPRILDGVDWPALNELVEAQFGVRLERQDQHNTQ